MPEAEPRGGLPRAVPSGTMLLRHIRRSALRRRSLPNTSPQPSPARLDLDPTQSLRHPARDENRVQIQRLCCAILQCPHIFTGFNDVLPCGRLATFTEQGELSDAAVFVRDNVIEWVGRDAELPPALSTADTVLELRDHVMIPGMRCPPSTIVFPERVASWS